MKNLNCLSNQTTRLFLTAFFTCFMTAAIISAISTPAEASEPKLLSTHNAWSAYTFTENGNKVCYMASTPTKAEGDYSKRGEIYALVTHRPAENTQDVFSYITGYTYKQNSDVNVKIGSKKYTLFTQDDTAWAPDAETDEDLADSIRRGSTMVVTGTSSRGTETKDTFSLRGSAAAYKAISKACDL